ncbi:type IX secretion system membrane protein PorP/SprF [Flavobacterium humidisoli]|uniref:Type IX secretion system membrane protein PorP/SprF n=1 Tax=Flavobacterium humidisoli TaxID=2937442 RepID=A0ABY4LYJ5_9FLAO|nr:type IX secretion system membrane protein PorP/SprF [Flavobacterium humidisoli]UPZ17887.1 type IX secretion system membrane protein PorP/SprF [Flavobacterium humidisoli]
MKKINYILTGTLLLFSGVSFSQQDASFTQYRYHMNSINPAYAAIGEETAIASSLRDQWTGVPDAPLTQCVSFGTPIALNTGIGLSIVNDRTFMEKQTFVGIDFSYKMKLNPALDLYFGLKAGGNFYSVNTSGLDTYNIQADPALISYTSFNPNVGLGFVLKNEKYYVSLSVPRILSTQKVRNQSGYAVMASDRAHWYFSGGYDFELDSGLTPLVLKPSLMLRYVSNAPVSADFNSMLEIAKIFEIGAMYRTDQAFGVLTDFTINKRLLLGYSYEWITKPSLGSARGTYELFLKYTF